MTEAATVGDRGCDGNASLLPCQCLTGDGWAGMMDDCMITPERGCDPAVGNCGGAHAVAFFVAFQILGSFVLQLGQSARLGGAPAQLLRLLRARLAAQRSSALPE